MRKIKLDRYWTPRGMDRRYLRKDNTGLMLDMSVLPEDYEVVIRPIKNMELRRREQIIYQNLKTRY